MIFCSVDTELLIIFTDTNDMSNEFTYCSMASLFMISYTFCTHKDKTENYICFAHSYRFERSRPFDGGLKLTKADQSRPQWMKVNENG